MNTDRLFALYDRVADAPDAVGRLRRFVLDLAVRGKLVEQDPADEPASELLRRIAAEKARLVQAGNIKAKQPLPENSHDKVSFSVPNSWASVCLAEIVVCLDYMRKPINAAERAKRIKGKNQEELFPYYGATQQQGWIDDFLFDEELVLLGEDGVPFFDPFRSKAYLIRGKTWVNNHAHVFRGILVSHLYLVHVLNVFDYTGRVVGATRAKLNQTRALDIPIPLPPLAEQHRIVANVDELMALCDRLEEARTVREDTRDRLTKASLARLSAADTDVPTFRSHARFAVDALPALTARTDQVKHLRQTILSLAVRGKLVEQDQSDEPVGSLLAYRAIRASDPQWFEIPATWAWVSVRAVAKSRLGKMLDKSKNTGAPRRYLRNVNVRWFNFDLSDVLEMRFEDAELPEFALRAGDVLICEGGEPGRAAVWDEREDDIYFQKAIHRVRFLDIVDGQYFVNALRASADEGRLAEYFTGTTIKHFTGTALRAYVFPLPPLAEQRRIVAKVDELMTLCDELEAGLDAAGGTRSLLLDSLLHESLGSHVAVINGKTGGVTRIGT